jgi:hypothetical protein
MEGIRHGEGFSIRKVLNLVGNREKANEIYTSRSELIYTVHTQLAKLTVQEYHVEYNSSRWRAYGMVKASVYGRS